MLIIYDLRQEKCTEKVIVFCHFWYDFSIGFKEDFQRQQTGCCDWLHVVSDTWWTDDANCCQSFPVIFFISTFCCECVTFCLSA